MHIQRINYDYWTKEILLAAADRSDKESFSTFVLDLPELSEGLFDLLRELAAEKARYVSNWPSLFTHSTLLYAGCHLLW